VSTPRTLQLPDGVRRVTVETGRGPFAALEALPATGACERQPALLIPGYTGSKEDFLLVLGPLAAAGRRVMAVDMRGQYETPGSPADAGAYDLAELAADVALIARELNSAGRRPGADGLPMHLLGHSFGGLVAQELVLTQAARISSLTLLSSGPGALTGPRASVLRGLLAQLAELPAGELPAEVKRLWETQLEPEAVANGTPPEIIDFLRTRMLASCATGLKSMAGSLLACPDRTSALAALAGPRTLVVYGEDDDAWAPAIQEQMARQLGAERVCIPGAAHSPAVEAPETAASILTTFWNAAECARRGAERTGHGAERTGHGAERTGHGG
jgi:pimeloyl-ACP methyl ester carboxylesterase